VNLPKLSVYSFRHKGTTVLRKAGVPVEQISYQLGHRRPEERSTRGYGEYDPKYLMDATVALEAWIQRILRLAKVRESRRAVRGKSKAG
jgi:integrase